MHNTSIKMNAAIPHIDSLGNMNEQPVYTNVELLLISCLQHAKTIDNTVRFDVYTEKIISIYRLRGTV